MTMPLPKTVFTPGSSYRSPATAGGQMKKTTMNAVQKQKVKSNKPARKVRDHELTSVWYCTVESSVAEP